MPTLRNDNDYWLFIVKQSGVMEQEIVVESYVEGQDREWWSTFMLLGAPLFLVLSLYQLFSSGDNFTFQKMFAISGDIFIGHHCEGTCYWHLVGKGPQWC